MEMDKEHFIKIMDLISGAYPNFNTNENTLRSYYYFLKPYKDNDVWSATAQWIRTNKYPPTISDLLEILDKIGGKQ